MAAMHAISASSGSHVTLSQHLLSFLLRLGVLDVLHCVLIDSPEALNVIKEQHIRTVISLIDKHGRDPKVRGVHIAHPVTSSRWKFLAKCLNRVMASRVGLVG